VLARCCVSAADGLEIVFDFNAANGLFKQILQLEQLIVRLLHSFFSVREQLLVQLRVAQNPCNTSTIGSTHVNSAGVEPRGLCRRECFASLIVAMSFNDGMCSCTSSATESEDRHRIILTLCCACKLRVKNESTKENQKIDRKLICKYLSSSCLLLHQYGSSQRMHTCAISISSAFIRQK
jgi:hypothetical protein